MEKPRVFIANKGNHSYNSAEEFGELIYVTKDRINVFSMDNLVSRIKNKLDRLQPQSDDYLLISGYAVVNAIAIHYFLNKFKCVKLLIYEANRKDSYKAVTLNDFQAQ